MEWPSQLSEHLWRIFFKCAEQRIIKRKNMREHVYEDKYAVTPAAFSWPNIFLWHPTSPPLICRLFAWEETHLYLFQSSSSNTYSNTQMRLHLAPKPPNSTINQSNCSAWHFQTQKSFKWNWETNTPCCSTACDHLSQVKIKCCLSGFDDKGLNRNQVVSCQSDP